MIRAAVRYPILAIVFTAGCSGDVSEPPAPTPAPVAVIAPQATPADAPLPAEGEPPLAELTMIDVDALRSIATETDGRPRVVNFWATWCGPCVAEIPEIVEFAHAHPEVEVILVNLDYRVLSRSHVVPFIARHDIRGVRVVQLDAKDPAASVAEAVDGWPYAIPFTLALAPSGARLATWKSAITREQLEEAVGKAAP